MNEQSSFTIEAPVPARFTIAEFDRLVSTSVFEGSDVELVEGVIIRMSPAMSLHVALQKQIYDQLLPIFPGGRSGLLTYSELSVVLAETTLRTIDVAVAGALPLENSYPAAESVFLAIEVANSSLAYDLAEKKRDYAGTSIPHYWVVDPEGRAIHTLSMPDGDDYMVRHLVRFGEPLTVPGTDQQITIEHPS